MTIKDVIDGFREGVEENVERNAYADKLFQEAVRIGMELNMQYHIPEEIREIMGRLTGKKVDDSFRMFPPRTVVGGVPAKVLKVILEERKIQYEAAV